jgi:hypothetical protein
MATKGPFARGLYFMNLPRNQLFPGPALSTDQYGRRSGRHLSDESEDALHSGGNPYQVPQYAAKSKSQSESIAAMAARWRGSSSTMRIRPDRVVNRGIFSHFISPFGGYAMFRIDRPHQPRNSGSRNPHRGRERSKMTIPSLSRCLLFLELNCPTSLNQVDYNQHHGND